MMRVNCCRFLHSSCGGVSMLNEMEENLYCHSKIVDMH